MSEEFETVEDYYEYWDEEATMRTRYGQVAIGRTEAVEDLGLLENDEPAIDPNDYREERFKTTKQNPNTVDAAKAKGAYFAVEELAEAELLEADDVEEEEVEDEDDEEEDDSEAERDTETIAESGGVEIDADDF